MKFLVDNQLPLQLAVYLRSRGHECAHVLELGLSTANDSAIWARAELDGWTLFSKDEDFVYFANRTDAAARLVWIRLGNCRNAALIDAIARIHDRLLSALESDDRIVEIR